MVAALVPADTECRLRRAQLGLVAVVAGTCLVSIFAAQLAFALACAFFLARLALRGAAFPRLPLDGPTLAFSVWTLLAASFSRNPLASHEESKKLLLFLLLYLAVETLSTEEARERVVDALLLGGTALSAGMLLQFYLLGFDTLNNRPRSLQGHYMTASGLIMCVLALGAARLAFVRRPLPRPGLAELRALVWLAAPLAVLTLLQRADLFALEGERLFVLALAGAAAFLGTRRGPWPTPAAPVLLAALATGLGTWALLVSRTRSAWLGAVAGLVLVAVLRAPKLLWLVGAGVLAVLVARPGAVMDRLTVSDASSVDRYYMWQAGVDMVLERPVFGQGPGMIVEIYPSYRWPQAPNPRAPHLHDNALQVAAERGLPCLVWWLWWVVRALSDSLREFRRLRAEGRFSPWPAAGALGVLTALLVAGLFEYNYGDSEVAMFMMVSLALTYALRRSHAAPPAESAAPPA